MQVASVTIKIGGDLRNTVRKHNISVAEVEVLRAIHGSDAVIDVELTGETSNTAKSEKARLFEIYKIARHSETGRPLVEETFPGANPNMPEKFNEIGLDLGELPKEDEEGEPKKKAPGRPSKKPEGFPSADVD